MEVSCFINSCKEPPSLVCFCKEVPIYSCLSHYGNHITTNRTTNHNPIELNKQVKENDKLKYLQYLQNLIENEKSIKSKTTNLMKEILNESNILISNSIYISKKLKEMLKSIKNKGTVFTLPIKDSKNNENIFTDDDMQRVKLVTDEYKNRNWKYFKLNDSILSFCFAEKQNEFENQSKLNEDKKQETLNSWSSESYQELSSIIKRLTSEKENLEKQLEQKQNTLKEIANSNAEQIGALEREKVIYLEKLSSIEKKYLETEKKLKNEIENLNFILIEKKEVVSGDKIPVHLENERLKTLLQETKNEMSERIASCERERLLWEQKFNFFTQQRDAARADLAEAHKKFDRTLEQVQIKSAIDKQKLEASTNTLIASIEARYTNQIKDAQESYTSQISTLNNKNKSLKTELRSIKEELELERRGRSIN